MLFRPHPSVQIGLLIVGMLVLSFMVMLSAVPTGDGWRMPSWMFRLLIGGYVVVYGYWIIDLLITSDKRGPGDVLRGRIVMMVVLTTIIFVYSVYWYGARPLPALSWSLLIGCGCPLTAYTALGWQSRAARLKPNEAELEAAKSPEAKRFLARFPTAKAYAYGLSVAESNRVHVAYHYRERLPVNRKVHVDYCMDVPIDMTLGRVFGGTERLVCYLYAEGETGALLGFLPTANIGRVLDVGFSKEELEDAYVEATDNEADWPVLGDLPLLVHKFSGKHYRVR